MKKKKVETRTHSKKQGVIRKAKRVGTKQLNSKK